MNLRFSVTILAACFALALPAQERSEANAGYKIDLVIRDGTDAAAKAGRRYTILISPQGRGVFRVGQRVPYATGSFQPGQGSGANPPVATQYQFADIGVNIECHIRELSNSSKVGLTADVDISSLVQHDKGANPTPPSPTVATTRIHIETSVTPGARVQAASIDDPVTSRKFEVEALVTKQM
ncbi:MAG: hypothetical protein HZB13_16480 [Acidobacteria bacterium]|nr:hypothetical protein [Acidobacteriota bacterium]